MQDLQDLDLAELRTRTTLVCSPPRVLLSSLTAPYADGFAFVQELRRRGGWPLVDATYRALPATTEQLLHIKKLDAREPAIPVAVPPLGALGQGFRHVFDDVMGEQGLRIVLEEWAHRTVAAKGAAGWGGDRLVVAQKDAPGDPARRALATAWHIVFDTEDDAREVEAILAARHGKGCIERSSLGAFAWAARGRAVAIAAGPYERRSAEAKAAGTCAATLKWVEAILKEGSRSESRTGVLPATRRVDESLKKGQ